VNSGGLRAIAASKRGYRRSIACQIRAMPSVLVVDDDPDIRELFGGGLEREGFDVVLAEDGARGIEALAHARFDLVVLDVFMPGVSGLDTIKLFHAHAPSVPLIAISGHVFVDHPFPDQFRNLALELGAARCLGKPLTVSALVREIRAVLNGSAQSSGGTDTLRTNNSADQPK